MIEKPMTIARHIILEGRVQGLGVRPAIARLAEIADLWQPLHF